MERPKTWIRYIGIHGHSIKTRVAIPDGWETLHVDVRPFGFVIMVGKW